MHHLQVANLLSDKQFGFLNVKFTTLQLMIYFDKCAYVIARGGVVNPRYLDFAEAFDSVRHRRLMGFNRDKYHILTLGKIVNITHTHRYKVADYEIEHVFDEKDLCVIFDS